MFEKERERNRKSYANFVDIVKQAYQIRSFRLATSSMLQKTLCAFLSDPSDVDHRNLPIPVVSSHLAEYCCHPVFQTASRSLTCTMCVGSLLDSKKMLFACKDVDDRL